MATTIARGRRRQDRSFTATQGVILALVICTAFWLALGGVLWLVLR